MMSEIKSVTIIGGGMGGLFTGAILAHEGLEVTVLEKNAVIGGGLQCFTRWGLVFETGMHILGGLRPGGNVYKICKYLGILHKLSLMDVDDDCTDEIHYLVDGHTYRISHGRVGFVESLAAEFPEQRENLERYVDALYAITQEVNLFHMRPGDDNLSLHSDEFMMAADELVAKYITDPRLRDILGYMNPMYGGVPGHTPAYIHALINELYIEGASRFVGGSQQLADALADVITANGGQVVNNSQVTRLEINDRRVDYAEDSKGRRFSSDLYISAIHPCGLLQMVGEGVFTKAYVNRLNEIPNSYSAFSLYIKLRPDTFRYINHTCYCQDDYGCVWEYGNTDTQWPRGFMYMTPPDPDQGEYANKLILVTPMVYDELKQWSETTVGHRGKEYEAWKEAKKDALIAKLRLVHPEIDDAIDSYVTASPLTIRDYYGVKEGSMYGFRKDCRNIMLSQVPQATKVRNLLLTGQNINLHGICGVPLTAINTAELLLGRDYLINKINEINTENDGKN